MAENKGSTAWLWWTLGVFAFLGLGTGTYFYLKNKGLIGNKSKEDGDGDEKNNNSSTPDNLNTGTSSYTPTSNTSSTPSVPSTNLTQEEGNKFREWMNQYHSDWRDSTNDKLDKTGKPDNTTIREAWAKYSTEYKNQQGSASSSSQGYSQTKGWERISGGVLANQGLKEENRLYNGSIVSEVTYYIIDVGGWADYVVHLKNDGTIYFGQQTLTGADDNIQGGYWFFEIKGDKEYWKIKMINGKGDGVVDYNMFAWMIKSVFNQQYPEVAETFKKLGQYSGFSLTDGYDFDGSLRGEQGKYVDPMDSMM